MYEALGNLLVSKSDASYCVVNKMTLARMIREGHCDWGTKHKNDSNMQKKKECLQQGSKYKCTEDGHGMDYSKNSKEACMARTQRTGRWHDTRLEREWSKITGHSKNLLYSKSNGMPLEDFKQGN